MEKEMEAGLAFGLFIPLTFKGGEKLQLTLHTFLFTKVMNFNRKRAHVVQR